MRQIWQFINFPYGIPIEKYALVDIKPVIHKPVKYFVVVFSARVAPFKLSFVSDADETILATGNAGAALTDEASVGAAVGVTGTIGFSLGFRQIPCA